MIRGNSISPKAEPISGTPNQFLFPLLAFPLAAFATFLAMKLIISTLQRTLGIMNPTVHALNVVQVFTSVFTGFCALFVTVLCVYVFKAESGMSQLPIVRNALSAVFFAVTFFSFFPILYAQQRSEVEYLVGAGFGFNLLESKPLRQIIGVEANWGTRSLLILCFMIAWIVIILYLWPWSNNASGNTQNIVQASSRTKP